ncbi:hypothetical protein KY285_016796 [Solanum tuberosum]|nr:hypothetical protein KY284_016792 [Solanum tuberosum]KAH0689648.1 hypothetical protein KY289_017006 [Solanum tuberosum]KAH0702518.1 hypothetical protein KY285_016796 [Solanum tuberosum]
MLLLEQVLQVLQLLEQMLQLQVAAGTSVATAGNAATSDLTNAAIESQSSVNAGLSAGLISARRHTNDLSSVVRPATALASSGRPTSATSSDVRHISKQKSTSSAAGQKRKTSTALRGGSVIERSGNTDRVLHSATLSSSTPTNIDLGYKPNGLIKVERKSYNHSKAATRGELQKHSMHSRHTKHSRHTLDFT